MRVRIEKINLFIISAILSIIIFAVLTLIQNKIINYEEQVKVVIAIEDIEKDSKLKNERFGECYVSASLADELDILTKVPENLYNRTEIYKGQFLLSSMVGTKEELKIIDGGANKEKISIEIDDEASMLSYQIKKGDKVNLYFTGKYVTVESILGGFSNVLVGNLSTVQLLQSEEILGIYDKDGFSSESEEFSLPSSVVFGVSNETAKIINNLRGQGDFSITIE